jgi:DNA replication and repair protein RecF
LGEELGALEVRLSYDQGWWRPGRAALQEEPPDEKEAQEALWLALKATRGEDLRRQFTSRGPHRDDLSLQLAGHSARSFASQGQQRALVLALKITEVQLFQQRRGFRPLLLLDDVSSELDRVRNRFLFSFLRQGEGQVFLSTTHRDHILLEDHVASFEVGEGQVRRAAS